jgi:hypothetical protein
MHVSASSVIAERMLTPIFGKPSHPSVYIERELTHSVRRFQKLASSDGPGIPDSRDLSPLGFKVRVEQVFRSLIVCGGVTPRRAATPG